MHQNIIWTISVTLTTWHQNGSIHGLFYVTLVPVVLHVCYSTKGQRMYITDHVKGIDLNMSDKEVRWHPKGKCGQMKRNIK